MNITTHVSFGDFFTLKGILAIVFQVNIFDNIVEKLSDNLLSDGGKFSGALGAIQVCYNMVFPIATMLLFVYFLLALVDKVSSETFTWEQLWKLFAMLLGTKILIEEGFQLLQLLFSIGLSMSQKVSEIFQTTDNIAVTDEQIEELINIAIENMDVPKFLRRLLLWMMMLPLCLLPALTSIAISVIVYARVIEIYLRTVYMPIALADFFHGGVQSNGWRSIKGFLAVSLQGATILVISIIYSNLSAALLSNYGGADHFLAFVGGTAALQFSAIALMFKSLNLTKEMLGVA